MLEELLRRPADFVARYGGEEFVAVLPETDAEGAAAIAEKIRGRIELMNILHEYSQAASHVTLSLGVATTIPTGDNSTTDLIEAADKMLYEAKEGGRDQVKSIHLA